jgi:vitamin B12 transporter
VDAEWGSGYLPEASFLQVVLLLVLTPAWAQRGDQFMRRILPLALACLLSTASLSWSAVQQTLEPVIVTATKLETPAREIASSVTVITEEEIEQKQQPLVLDLLRSVPALNVVQSGGLGQQSSVFIRGANSEHTLVLIDGIEVNDPSTPSRSYNFEYLTTGNIERIEVVRGPESTLYGSDAIGGVINIITKKGQGIPSLTVSAEGGSYETHQEKIGLSGGNELVNYTLFASYLNSNGISAAGKDYGNDERDGYENLTASSRIGLTPTDNFDLDFFLRFTDAESDLDAFNGPGGDDPNYRSDYQALAFRTEARLLLFNQFWEQKLGFSLTDYDRDTRDDKDTVRPDDAVRSSFNGNLYKVDWQNNLYLHETNTLTFGIEYQEEEADIEDFQDHPYLPAPTTEEYDKRADTTVYYLQDQIKLWDSFFTSFGIRLDDHEEFGSRTTYRVASSYIFNQTGTKFRATWGTGFKAPSLGQLYDPSSGNPNLDPEKSEGWDAGIDQFFWGNRASVSLTYFENDFEDLIVSEVISWVPFISTYQNVNKVKTKGVEFVFTLNPMTNLFFNLNYTYTDTKNEETGDELLRRPRNKFSANINYKFLDRGDVNLNVIYVGEREDYIGFVVDELDSYTLVNLAASFKLTENFRLFGRVDNLLDEDYEEVWGYGTAGIGGYAGAEYTF